MEDLHRNLHTLGSELLDGIQGIGQQLEAVAQRIESLSIRLDYILNRLDASLKAAFDNGLEAIELFDRTGEDQHLVRALDHLANFINTFERVDTRSGDEDDLLLLARYYRIAAYADLYASRGIAGYAHSAVESFRQLQSHTRHSDFLLMTYLGMVAADVDGKAGEVIFQLIQADIDYHIASGNLNQALKQADWVHTLLDSPSSREFRQAVREYVTTGQPNPMIMYADADYTTLMQHITGGKGAASDTSPYVRHIVGGKASPADMLQMLQRYQYAEMTRFAVRELLRGGYFRAAWEILNEYPVNDDTFRIKACLIIFKTIDSATFQNLLKLVLENDTYSREARDFAARMVATS